jgi:hypothetical protein
MKQLKIISSDPTWTVLLSGLMLALLAFPVAAGDNDPVGDLPKSEDEFGDEEALQGPDVPDTIDDEPDLADGDELDSEPTRAALLRKTVGGGEQYVSPPGGQTLHVHIDPTVDASLLLPEDVVFAEAFLVVDDAAQANLGTLLSGNAPVQAVVRTGLFLELDLDKFARLADQHLPAGWSATWVVASVDSQGVSHLAAARVSADGALTEILID